jgi:hypothetical protein
MRTRTVVGGLVMAYAAAESAAITALWRVAAVQAISLHQAGAGRSAQLHLFWAMVRAWARFQDFLPWRSWMFIRSPGLVVAWAVGSAFTAWSLWRLVRRWIPAVSDTTKPHGKRVPGRFAAHGVRHAADREGAI